MASNFECIGLPVESADELGKLMQRTQASTRSLGRFGGVIVGRWEDSSGSTLQIGVTGNNLDDLTPTFAGDVGATLSDCTWVNDTYATADVLDESGEMVARMIFDAEDYRRLLDAGAPVDSTARITAFGNSVEIFKDADDFEKSRSSWLDPDADPLNPPEGWLEKGHLWPSRLAAESFIPTGMFSTGDDLSPRARISGVVVSAKMRRCSLTRKKFITAVVRTIGFEATVCLAVREHRKVPRAGNVISGDVYLVAGLTVFEASSRN